VLVTHSQNCDQAEAPWRCWMVVVMSTGYVVLNGLAQADTVLNGKEGQAGNPPCLIQCNGCLRRVTQA